MTRIAVIACDHGLGHVRRSVLIADALVAARDDVTVDVLAPDGAAARVRASLGSDRPARVHDVDFATRTTPEGLRAGAADTGRWEERLPDLDRHDLVVCDTLPEVLAVRPDAVLVAQFLWHDVLDGVAREVRERGVTLAATAPLVVGSEPFAMPAVRALPGFVPVGLHAPAGRPVAGSGAHAGRHARADRAARDLLVTGGTTPALVADLRVCVAALAAQGPGPYGRVLVDEGLLPDAPPGWMHAAVHGHDGYDGLAAAIVRPGLGIVTELLARGVPMWCVHEQGNAELAHNAATVERLGAGVAVTTAPARLAERVLAGPPVPGPATLRPPTFDGAERTAALVLGRLDDDRP